MGKIIGRELKEGEERRLRNGVQDGDEGGSGEAPKADPGAGSSTKAEAGARTEAGIRAGQG